MSAAAPKLSLELPLSQRWCCISPGPSPDAPGWESGSFPPLAAPYGVTAGALHLQPCSGNHPVPDMGAGPG